MDVTQDHWKGLMLAGAVALTSLSFGTDPAAGQVSEIDEALAAAPSRARDATMVIRWNADQTYDVLKEGDGPLLCYDRSSEARRAAFDVQCTSKGNLDRVAQSRRFRADAADREEENAMVQAAEADGTRVAPVYGSIWFSLRGEDQESARMHMTVAVPFATAESSGFPDHGRDGGLWIMAGGTSTAHLMVPSR